MATTPEPHTIQFCQHEGLQKNFRLDLKSMFSGLIKGVVGFLNPEPLSKGQLFAEAALDLGSSVEISDKIEARACQLVMNSTYRAFMKLVTENQNIFRYEAGKFQQLLDQINDLPEEQLDDDAEFERIEQEMAQTMVADQIKLLDSLPWEVEEDKLAIGKDFLDNPRGLPLVPVFTQIFKDWLVTVMGLSDHVATALSNRFPFYFVLEVHTEWRNKAAYYAPIEAVLSQATTPAVEREIGRMQYNAWLQRVPYEKMFDEAFSVEMVYVPLRAYYEDKLTEENKEEPRINVFDAQKHILNWVEANNPKYSFLVIKGGPGSGKSVLAKRISAQVAASGTHKVYHIPLHKFILDNSVKEGIENFIQLDEYLFREDPFNRESPEGSEPVLFVFDGLDELAKAGAVSLELARQFVGDLQKLVSNHNGTSKRIKVIITGRDLVIQQNDREFSKPGQLIRLMPFHPAPLDFDERKVKRGRKSKFREDQRKEWWGKYCEVKGKNYDETTASLLESRDLMEVSAEPLLNYLLARALDKDPNVLAENNNLNNVYRSLVIGVFQRTHDGNRKHVNLSEANFQRILEEVAIAAWHGGDVRAVPYQRILARCQKNRLTTLLEEFGGLQEKGFMSLLVSFFFHQGQMNEQGEKTFEFTHKSFGEYLAVLRIVREGKKIHKAYKAAKEDFDYTFDLEKALEMWLELCGPAEIGENMMIFLWRELALHWKEEEKEFKEELVGIQDTLEDIFNYLLKNGWPIPPGVTREPEVTRRTRNAEITLLLFLSGVVQQTKKVAQFKWENEYSAGQWLARLCPHRGGGGDLAVKGLSSLDFGKQDLENLNLYHSILEGARLDGAKLSGAKLSGARLYGARLDGALLDGALLDGARLSGASLEGTMLYRASLDGASLYSANLYRAILDGASLYRANLYRAILDGTRLNGASLDGTTLNGASLDSETRIPQNQLGKLKCSHAFVNDKRLKGQALQDFLESIAVEEDDEFPF